MPVKKVVAAVKRAVARKKPEPEVVATAVFTEEEVAVQGQVAGEDGIAPTTKLDINDPKHGNLTSDEL
jgi:hypothetical protein